MGICGGQEDLFGCFLLLESLFSPTLMPNDLHTLEEMVRFGTLGRDDDSRLGSLSFVVCCSARKRFKDNLRIPVFGGRISYKAENDPS